MQIVQQPPCLAILRRDMEQVSLVRLHNRMLIYSGSFSNYFYYLDCNSLCLAEVEVQPDSLTALGPLQQVLGYSRGAALLFDGNYGYTEQYLHPGTEDTTVVKPLPRGFVSMAGATLKTWLLDEDNSLQATSLTDIRRLNAEAFELEPWEDCCLVLGHNKLLRLDYHRAVVSPFLAEEEVHFARPVDPNSLLVGSDKLLYYDSRTLGPVLQVHSAGGCPFSANHLLHQCLAAHEQGFLVGTSAGVFWFDQRRPEAVSWLRNVKDCVLGVATVKDSVVWVGNVMVGMVPLIPQQLDHIP
jgi:hypothetical protein